MAVKYHINPVTKRPNMCKAQHSSSCPYYDSTTGTPAPHFDNKPEARKYVEQELNKIYGQAGSSMNKSNNSANSFNEVKKHYGVEEVYQHPQGKIIKIENGVAVAYKNGKKAYTSATAEKLKNGYGQWKQVTDKDLLLPEFSPKEDEDSNESISFEKKPMPKIKPVSTTIKVAEGTVKPNPKLASFTHEDEVYTSPNGKLMYIDEYDIVRAYDKYGMPTKTVLTAEKLRKGFGSWKKEQIEPPPGWKPKSKSQMYADEQDKIIKKLSKFMKTNPGYFYPTGKVQAKYWSAIKEGNVEGKSTAIKDTMIKSGISAIYNAGYKIDKWHLTSKPPLLDGKLALQKEQNKAINDLINNHGKGSYGSSYTPVAHKQKPGPKPKVEHNLTNYVKEGIDYNSLNEMPAVNDFLKEEKVKVGASETIDGLTFTNYRKKKTGMAKDMKKTYSSLVDVSGNIEDFDFTKDPEIYKKFGFQGSSVFSIYAGYESAVKELSKVSVSKLSSTESGALNWFTGGSYSAFNRVIFKRTGISKNSSTYKNYRAKMNAMDKALAKAPKVNKVVYRSMRRTASVFNSAPGSNNQEKIDNYVKANYEVGKTVEFKGYQSSSTDPSFAKGWGDGGVLFEIMTPEGMPVHSISQHKSESEVILPRESKYVIVGKQKVGSGYGSYHVVQMMAVNDDGDILDGTNSGKKSTWEQLWQEPLVNKI